MRPRIVMILVALTVALAARDHGRAAPGAPPMAAELPAGSLVTLEVEDLAAGLARWRDSQLRRALTTSEAYAELRKARVFRKLTSRVTGLEELLGTQLTLDRLILMAGRRAALGLYDVSDTSFVLVAETTAEAAGRSPLWGARSRMEPREHAGLAYFLAKPTPRRHGAAVALVGNRLVFGNDLDRFPEALLLAAKGAGVRARAAAGPAVADDPRYRRLAAASPPDLLARVFVDQARLSGTRQFDERWIFDPHLAATVDAALLGLRPGAGETVETRAYCYRAAAGRPAVTSPPPAAGFGHADAAALAPLLGFAPFVSARPTDAADAGRALGGLIGATTAAAQARLTALLAAAAPVRSVELAAPAAGSGLAAHDRAGIALVFAAPGRLDVAALEAAVLEGAAHGLAVGGATGATLVDEGGARVVRLPFVDELRPTLRLEGGVLVVATDPELTRRLALALPRLAAYTQVGAPVALRLDVPAAAAAYADVTGLLAARTNWSRTDAAFFSGSVAGLRALWPDAGAIIALGFGQGELYLEEVHYRDRVAAAGATPPAP
jgi:hypothetical protein